MIPRVCIFDLDGTLFDSRYQILNAVHATRTSFGLSPTSLETIESKIGFPAETLFEDLSNYPISKSELVARFRENLRIEIERNNPIFPGVHELLSLLREMDVRICVATNKPTNLAIHTIRNSEIAEFFNHIQGSSGFFPKPHPGMLWACLGSDRASDALMFGDTTVDIIAATSACIPAVGVAHNETNRQTLLEVGAQFVISSFRDLDSIMSIFQDFES